MNSITTLFRALQIQKTLVIPTQYVIQTKGYAVIGFTKKKIGKKAGPIAEKKVLPVETDVNKLVNYVCGTDITKEGEPVKIKPDSEYPDWLWTLHTGPPVPLEELDPNTLKYWRRLRKISLQRNNKLSKLKSF